MRHGPRLFGRRSRQDAEVDGPRAVQSSLELRTEHLSPDGTDLRHDPACRVGLAREQKLWAKPGGTPGGSERSLT